MLFLSPFIRPPHVAVEAWTFEAAWTAFLQLKEVAVIERNLQCFVSALDEQRYPSRKDVLEFMASAVCRGRVVDAPKLYDARYFCVLNGVAHTIGQYVSCCVARLIETHHRMELFRDRRWLTTIQEHRANPSVLGFLVEKAAIGCLSDIQVVARLLRRPDLLSERVEVRTFGRGTESSSLGKGVVTLYIPTEFNYKAVDAVLRIVDRRYEHSQPQPKRASSKRKHSSAVALTVDAAAGAASASSSNLAGASSALPFSTTVTLLPIQITVSDSVSEAKRAASFRFFERRAAWCDDFRDDARARIQLHFAFIVRQCAVRPEEKALRVDGGSQDSFDLSFFSLSELDPQLGRVVS